MADRHQARLGLRLDVAAHHLAGLHVERRRAGNEDEAVGLGHGRARDAERPHGGGHDGHFDDLLFHGGTPGLGEESLSPIGAVAGDSRKGQRRISRFQQCPTQRLRSTAPPSVLPDISPTGGEIGRPRAFRQSPTLQEWRGADDSRSPPMWGRCPAGQRGARRNAAVAACPPTPSAQAVSTSQRSCRVLKEGDGRGGVAAVPGESVRPELAGPAFDRGPPARRECAEMDRPARALQPAIRTGAGACELQAGVRADQTQTGNCQALRPDGPP